MPTRIAALLVVCFSLACAASAEELPDGLTTLKYNSPGLVVDLHVGLWAMPIPLDFDDDGDLDLLVNCPDVPMHGIYFFENPGTPSDDPDADASRPVFKAPVRVGDSHPDLTPSYKGDGIDRGSLRLLSRNSEVGPIAVGGFQRGDKIRKYDRFKTPSGQSPKPRARQFSYVDFDGDGVDDLIGGMGDWADYGTLSTAGSEEWTSAYNAEGIWQQGPLHGYVYVMRNTGTSDKPKYAVPQPLEAGGEPIDVYGRPSPNFADFDGDGDLDLICGEFLDGFTYFQNTGSRTEPVYAAGQRLSRDGQPVTMDLEMVVPVAIDWDRDGDVDLVVGDEDGRVALVEHTGRLQPDGMPVFERPFYFQQQADDITIGALVTPEAIDWDSDGDVDLICGNSAGYVVFVENLSGPTKPGERPRFAAPQRLQTDMATFRVLAGPSGSVQGPSEIKWGYTTLSAADWDGDGDPDIVLNSVWGKPLWIETIGRDPDGKPLLTSARPVRVAWTEGTAGHAPMPRGYWWAPAIGEAVTQWRTTPEVIDWNGDGLMDLIMLDHEGYLALWKRRADGDLEPPARIFRAGEGPSVFDPKHQPQSEASDLLRLNGSIAGRGGRVKIAIADWDGDGHRDLLVNSENINWMKGQPGDDGTYTFTEQGPVTSHRLAGHTTSPAMGNFDGIGRDDLLIGAEDGRLYLLRRD